MNNEHTQHHPVEPTTPVPPSGNLYNPYGPHTDTPTTPGMPYGYDFIGIPPPPPKRHRVSLGLLVVSLIIAVLLFLSAGLFYLARSFAVSPEMPTPIVRFISATPTAPTTPQATAHPSPTVDPNYTATDIMIHFEQAGVKHTFVQNNVTIWSWSSDTYYVSVRAKSSVTWADDSGCTGYCSPQDMGLWVYVDNNTAQSAYMQVGTDEEAKGSIPMIGLPPLYIHGRCLLLGAPQHSVYEQVVQQYCV